MSVQYINRKGRTHYLHEGVTKTGKPRYHFSCKSKGILVDVIPEGFEIYETPNGQVCLRRVQAKIITDEELAVVDRGMQQFSNLTHYQVDLKQKVIRVFIADQDVDNLSGVLSRGGKKDEVQEILNQLITYSPLMEFILVDKKERLFTVRRYCYRGSVDGWINVGGPGALEELAKEYVRHLGEESYFELF